MCGAGCSADVEFIVGFCDIKESDFALRVSKISFLRFISNRCLLAMSFPVLVICHTNCQVWFRFNEGKTA